MADRQFLKDQAVLAMERLAFESPGFEERAAAHVELNRKLSRLMPVAREDCVVALDVMEWAHGSPDAELTAPEDVANYRAFCTRSWIDEAHWRTAYDMALGIWKQAYSEHLRKQAAF